MAARKSNLKNYPALETFDELRSAKSNARRLLCLPSPRWKAGSKTASA